MRIDCITIFPEMFAPMKQSIMGRAQSKGILQFNTVFLRDFAVNDYGQVDDVPYGGEPGMVLRPEPLAQAIRSTGVKEDGGKVIYMTADGVPLTHQIAADLSKEEHLVIVCGHYKGIDDRIRQSEVDMEISIGDFVVSGGELPAMLLTDAVVRLKDGALGNRESGDTDSFAQGLLAPGLARLHPTRGFRGKTGARGAFKRAPQEHFGVAEARILEKNSRKTARHP